MSLINPLRWVLSLYPTVREVLDEDRIARLCDRADDVFPRAANGIRRGREKLAWVRDQLEHAYSKASGWAPAFDRVWLLIVPLIERYLARRKA